MGGRFSLCLSSPLGVGAWLIPRCELRFCFSGGQRLQRQLFTQAFGGPCREEVGHWGSLAPGPSGFCPAIWGSVCWIPTGLRASVE